MSEENGAVIDGGEEAPEVVAETPETTAEVAAETPPETPAEPAKVEFSPEQQAKFNEEIGKKVGQTHAEKRRADELQEQLDEMKAAQPKPERPELPKAPDPYSPTYAEDLAKYTQAVTKQASYDASERVRSEQTLQQQQEAQRQQQEEANKAIADYSGRADKLGIKPEQLQKAGQSLGQYNIDDSVAAYILDEPVGPQITVYLAENPALADEIANMAPMMAVAKIAAEIKPLAAGIKPQIDLAPDPGEVLSGKGAAEGLKGPKGATFE
tara:strand:- start:2080 stop:2883 length:804 start_codon:yes stop_codon:yes gene_type:complete